MKVVGGRFKVELDAIGWTNGRYADDERVRDEVGGDLRKDAQVGMAPAKVGTWLAVQGSSPAIVVATIGRLRAYR